MKTIAAIVAVILVAIVAHAQTVIYALPPTTPPAPGYTYYNSINPATGNSSTGFIYTQPTSPTTGFQQDMTTGEQSTYSTQGNITLIIPVNPK